jgi:hypothetical protein
MLAPTVSWAQILNQIPQPPTSPPPPHGPILIYALFNWALVLLVFVLLVREAFRTRSFFPIAFLIGGSLAAFTEPVFDGNIHVLFVYPPGTHPSWHFYNVPYPWYELIGNSCLAGPVYWMYHKFRTGVSTPALWGYFFLSWAIDGIQELPGTVMGAYVYYGPQPFVVANWPVWVGMLAAIGYPLTGYAAYAMQKVLTGARLSLAYIVVMPAVIYGCEVVAWPMWISLNGGKSLAITHLAAIVSLAFTATAYYVLILVYGQTQTAAQPVPKTAPNPPWNAQLHSHS